MVMCLLTIVWIISKNAPVKYNIIFDKPWNRDVREDGTKTFRVHGWEEIYKLISKLEED